MSKLTPSIIAAVGMDAGNTAMRRAGRTHWNEDDYNASAEATDPLWRNYYESIGIIFTDKEWE